MVQINPKISIAKSNSNSVKTAASKKAAVETKVDPLKLDLKMITQNAKMKGSGTKKDPYVYDGFLGGDDLTKFTEIARQKGCDIYVKAEGRLWRVPPTGGAVTTLDKV